MRNNKENNQDTPEKQIKWKKTGLGVSEGLFKEVYEAVSDTNSEQVPSEYEQAYWDNVVTFNKYPVPSFPISVFNNPIKSMVENVSESVQTPIDLPGTVALGVLSTCLAKKFKVVPKSNWSEPINLFIVSLLDPSNRKSAVFSAMTKPIKQYEREIVENMKLTVHNRRAERQALEKRIEFLQREFAKDENPEQIEEINQINKQLIELPELSLPTLMVDDATPEALVSKMNENNGKIAILSAEGDLFERFKNKNTDQIKYDVFLKSYSGDQLRIDRITRPTESIDNPNLTICLTAQPSIIKDLPNSMHDRGLMARFLYSIPNDNLGYRKSRTSEVPSEVTNSYIKFIQKLLNWETDETIPLKLSDDAVNLLYKTMDEIEIEFLENGAFHDELKSWAGKLVGQLLRIAGLLHVASNALTVEHITDVSTTISKETLENALALKNYFIAHTEKAFGVMKQNQNFDDAEFVLKKILNENSPIVEKQTIHQNTKKKIKGKGRLQRAYDILEYHSYIQQVIGGKSGRKGLIMINPQLYDSSEGHNKNLNYPKYGKTVENITIKEGDIKTLEDPNSPKNTTVINTNKQKKEEQESPTTPSSLKINSKNDISNINNYTPNNNEYKVEKE